MVEKYESIKELGDKYRPVDVTENIRRAKVELGA
jgi:hypothetical protein